MPALRATYRLQLGPALGFREARELVPYVRDLGVSHLYLSPSLQARSGSTHGYDVVDPTRISEDLGFTDDWGGYDPLTRTGRYTHRRINHSARVYVSGDVHTV